MQKYTLSFQNPSVQDAAAISVAGLEYYIHGYLVDCEIRSHSPNTIALRRLILGNLVWFLQLKKLECCSRTEIRLFLEYVKNGHKEPGGRWGNAQLTKPVSKRTLRDYHGHLRTFFRWSVKEGALPADPMENIEAPICRADQIKPFTEAQIEALLRAARQTQNALRDEAIVYLFFDTGIRVSELAGLKRSDLDLNEKRITVLGKGDKKRTVYFGRTVAKALWTYLRFSYEDGEDGPLFPSERGSGKDLALSRFGMRDLIYRLADKAGIDRGEVRCSAHTFRHSHAVAYLRAGGTIEGLKERLGHEDVKMTLKYVRLAEADLAGQRQFSTADRLAKRKK